MEQVFALLVVFEGLRQQAGLYATEAACRRAAAAYVVAECRAVDGTGSIYGTCWGCMHGCTWQTNMSVCGSDPRPRR